MFTNCIVHINLLGDTPYLSYHGNTLFLLTSLFYPQRKVYSVVENLLKSEAAFLTSLNIAIEVSFFFDKNDEVYGGILFCRLCISHVTCYNKSADQL